ncbi:MAG: hypothetical protein H6R15_3625 [Proteobacteria bacterium]|nr:hypothetical protein [Pseudomonadota bacterium]
MNMSNNPLPRLGGLLAAAFCSLAAAAPAPDVNLLVEHEITEKTSDGVTRQLHYAERVYRRAGLVWIERVLPPGAHDAAEHAHGDHEHKHLDLAAAAKLITLDADKLARIKLVNTHDKVVINVPSAEYGNVGFDGSWENAVHLLDPKQLKTMQPIAGKAQNYQLKRADTTVRVAWDAAGEFPRQVESGNASGTRHKLMRVRQTSAPATTPWTTLQGYAQKEYSDYLD